MVWGGYQRNSEVDITDRVRAARDAVDAHQSSSGVPADGSDAVVFLVADLMHLCSRELGVDFQTVLTQASTHVMSELVNA